MQVSLGGKPQLSARSHCAQTNSGGAKSPARRFFRAARNPCIIK